MFRKTTLIVTMLVAAAQIHPEIACSKLLRTDKTADSKTPSVFLWLALTPLARSIWAWFYTTTKISAHFARFNI